MWPPARTLERHLKVCQERQMTSDLPRDDDDPVDPVLIWVTFRQSRSWDLPVSVRSKVTLLCLLFSV